MTPNDTPQSLPAAGSVGRKCTDELSEVKLSLLCQTIEDLQRYYSSVDIRSRKFNQGDDVKALWQYLFDVIQEYKTASMPLTPELMARLSDLVIVLTSCADINIKLPIARDFRLHVVKQIDKIWRSIHDWQGDGPNQLIENLEVLIIRPIKLICDVTGDVQFIDYPVADDYMKALLSFLKSLRDDTAMSSESSSPTVHGKPKGVPYHHYKDLYVLATAALRMAVKNISSYKLEDIQALSQYCSDLYFDILKIPGLCNSTLNPLETYERDWLDDVVISMIRLFEGMLTHFKSTPGSHGEKKSFDIPQESTGNLLLADCAIKLLSSIRESMGRLGNTFRLTVDPSYSAWHRMKYFYVSIMTNNILVQIESNHPVRNSDSGLVRQSPRTLFVYSKRDEYLDYFRRFANDALWQQQLLAPCVRKTIKYYLLIMRELEPSDQSVIQTLLVHFLDAVFSSDSSIYSFGLDELEMLNLGAIYCDYYHSSLEMIPLISRGLEGNKKMPALYRQHLLFILELIASNFETLILQNESKGSVLSVIESIFVLATGRPSNECCPPELIDIFAHVSLMSRGGGDTGLKETDRSSRGMLSFDADTAHIYFLFACFYYGLDAFTDSPQPELYVFSSKYFKILLEKLCLILSTVEEGTPEQVNYVHDIQLLVSLLVVQIACQRMPSDKVHSAVMKALEFDRGSFDQPHVSKRSQFEAMENLPDALSGGLGDMRSCEDVSLVGMLARLSLGCSLDVTSDGLTLLREIMMLRHSHPPPDPISLSINGSKAKATEGASLITPVKVAVSRKAFMHFFAECLRLGVPFEVGRNLIDRVVRFSNRKWSVASPLDADFVSELNYAASLHTIMLFMHNSCAAQRSVNTKGKKSALRLAVRLGGRDCLVEVARSKASDADDGVIIVSLISEPACDHQGRPSSARSKKSKKLSKSKKKKKTSKSKSAARSKTLKILNKQSFEFHLASGQTLHGLLPFLRLMLKFIIQKKEMMSEEYYDAIFEEYYDQPDLPKIVLGGVRHYCKVTVRNDHMDKSLVVALSADSPRRFCNSRIKLKALFNPKLMLSEILDSKTKDEFIGKWRTELSLLGVKQDEDVKVANAFYQSSLAVLKNKIFDVVTEFDVLLSSLTGNRSMADDDVGRLNALKGILRRSLPFWSCGINHIVLSDKEKSSYELIQYFNKNIKTEMKLISLVGYISSDVSEKMLNTFEEFTGLYQLFKQHSDFQSDFYIKFKHKFECCVALIKMRDFQYGLQSRSFMTVDEILPCYQQFAQLFGDAKRFDDGRSLFNVFPTLSELSCDVIEPKVDFKSLYTMLCQLKRCGAKVDERVMNNIGLLVSIHDAMQVDPDLCALRTLVLPLFVSGNVSDPSCAVISGSWLLRFVLQTVLGQQYTIRCRDIDLKISLPGFNQVLFVRIIKILTDKLGCHVTQSQFRPDYSAGSLTVDVPFLSGPEYVDMTLDSSSSGLKQPVSDHENKREVRVKEPRDDAVICGFKFPSFFSLSLIAGVWRLPNTLISDVFQQRIDFVRDMVGLNYTPSASVKQLFVAKCIHALNVCEQKKAVLVELILKQAARLEKTNRFRSSRGSADSSSAAALFSRVSDVATVSTENAQKEVEQLSFYIEILSMLLGDVKSCSSKAAESNQSKCDGCPGAIEVARALFHDILRPLYNKLGCDNGEFKRVILSLEQFCQHHFPVNNDEQALKMARGYLSTRPAYLAAVMKRFYALLHVSDESSTANGMSKASEEPNNAEVLSHFVRDELKQYPCLIADIRTLACLYSKLVEGGELRAVLVDRHFRVSRDGDTDANLQSPMGP